MNKPLSKLLFASVIFVSLILLCRWFLTGTYLTPANLVEFIEMARQNKWILGLFYVGFILAVLAMPISLFPVLGGILFQFWVALPLNLLAATVGAWISFLIARSFGRQSVAPYLKQHCHQIDQVSDKHGFKAVFLIRWIGMPPFLFVNYALGLSPVRHKDFILGTVLGILPWMAFMTYMSSTIWRIFLQNSDKGWNETLFSVMLPMTGFSLAIGSLFLIGWLVRRRPALAV